MGKPKYQIGDAFLVERQTTQDGCLFKGVFNYYVIAVTAESTVKGYTYKYGLGRVFPQAYLAASVQMWDYEETLNKRTRAEGYFG